MTKAVRRRLRSAGPAISNSDDEVEETSDQEEMEEEHHFSSQLPSGSFFILDNKRSSTGGAPTPELHPLKTNDASDSSDSDDDVEPLKILPTTHCKSQYFKQRPKKSKDNQFSLASSLQTSEKLPGTYLKSLKSLVKSKKKPTFDDKVDQLLKSRSQDSEMMKKSVVTAALEKKSTIPPYEETLRQGKKKRREERSKTKGKDWFNMKAPEMTEEKKNDLMVIKMRNALDPKRFYSAPDLKGLPKYFQTGRVIAAPGEFYSRIPKKQQKQSLVDELMADAQFKKFSKRKVAEIDSKKSKWRGAHKHMKRLKNKK
ncbi:hypothetical protein CAPTEDRAFT_183521 [Capitella teleta]|uniref:Fcf2 pre-rRNA processing C-terminal domain-containing protein n=1 Tax=Capitella teleta TaxID=283909 RepID=R7TV09_CAPTE|nr:hypothetical protein CAPTEDRAFT_183521 [Capitella teleta]|eukprot:ELT97559.1 hypothetical protein CAPTEDRAFT_183521 [Capitella teleta]